MLSLSNFFFGGGGEGGRTRYIMEMRKWRISITISETGRELYLQIYGVLFLKMNEVPCDRKSGGGLGIYVKR